MAVDDEMSLADLVSQKQKSKPKVSEDTPLAALAKKGGNASPKASPKTASKNSPASPKASAKSEAGSNGKAGSPKAAAAKRTSVPGKGAGKGKGKKKGGGSSDSYSYSGSYSSDESEAPKKAPKKKASGKAPIKRAKTVDDAGAGDEGGPVKKKIRNTKEEVAAKLLCRWWYAEEYQKQEWPPQEGKFYEAELLKRNLRVVGIEEWEWVPETDEKGRHKVYELAQFRGVYRNSAGELVDLRPKERCPCLNNFMKKDLPTLCNMLISAYSNQLKELKNCRYLREAQRVAKEIEVELTKIRNLQQQSALAR
eukprot:CAMPEP_0206465658 /NCGR_PEP_ID=MMETSP0324_2-20121206/27970_1 /ASSEMBLY_ACC=CAM_ASM_000836 /TAXON_ID=2866 /ORGANISM="Crypthecodinium cohnii, Strain Seligo" /LENGTH=308 /DNA_ID=CAMNT_0053938577 /DNA_START=149 /DNA_END=1075 /DNA_ORIENTATION=+